MADQNMTTTARSLLAGILAQRHSEILENWIQEQTSNATVRRDVIRESEMREQSRGLLAAIRTATQSGALDGIDGPAWGEARDLLRDLSRTRAVQGFSVSETATFVFSLKRPILTQLRLTIKDDAERLAAEFWNVEKLVDQLGLETVQTFIETRENVIRRQQQEMLELSTPVVRLFEGVLALPLIGTLDSARTQVVMENLLEEIVRSGASIAILDITGVPTVDTLVAQHLLKTVAAARLMGADCIISGIRPQIAQTIVHLGLDLQNVTTKATLADALKLAMQRLGHTVLHVQTDNGRES